MLFLKPRQPNLTASNEGGFTGAFSKRFPAMKSCIVFSSISLLLNE
jgi:hypothetical protein